MITYQRDPRQQTIPASAVKIIGLGGAGTNMLEHVALDGPDYAELLALNTDVRTLNACMAGEKIQLGANLTKGLGAGGDPELGYQAMLEAEEEIRASLRGRRIVFLCVGLGGGTGSGAAPVVTRIAREEGAFVVVFATMPFAFEGRRRREQADTALNELAVLSNALVTFDNNRMGELVLAKQGIHEAFAAADRMICESIKAVIRLVVRPGLINVGLDDLMSALRTNRSRCLFGSGLAKGKDRAAAALRNALSSPLLDQGALLKDAQTVLVHLCGGEDLTLYEVELMMQRLQKFVPDSAHVLFGAAVDPAMADSLSITLISALPEDALAAAPREDEQLAEDDILAPSDSFTAAPAPPDPEPEPVPASIPVPAPETAPAAVSEPTAVRAASATPSQAATPAAPRHRTLDLAAAAAEIPNLFADSPFAEADESPEEGPPETTTALFASVVPPKGAEDDRPTSAPPAPAEPQPDEDFAGTGLTPAAGPAGSEPDDGHDAPETPAAGALPAKSAPPVKRMGPFTFGRVNRDITAALRTWGKGANDEPPVTTANPAAPRTPEPAPQPTPQPAPEPAPKQEAAPASAPEVPKLKLGVKGAAGAPHEELELGSTPRGRFEGQDPALIDGEDLDLPPFLRKKK